MNDTLAIIDKATSIENIETIHYCILFYIITNNSMKMKRRMKGIIRLVQNDLNINALNHAKGEYYGVSVLHACIIMDLLDEVNFLLFLGCDKDKKTLNGYTPMDFAIFNNNYKMATLLLQHKCTTDGYIYITTALRCYADEYFMMILLRGGCDINEIDHNGHTALYYAKTMRRDMIRFIKKNGGRIENEGVWRRVRRYAKETAEILRIIYNF
jgi:hypothetical protein